MVKYKIINNGVNTIKNILEVFDFVNFLFSFRIVVYFKVYLLVFRHLFVSCKSLFENFREILIGNLENEMSNFCLLGNFDFWWGI